MKKILLDRHYIEIASIKMPNSQIAISIIKSYHFPIYYICILCNSNKFQLFKRHNNKIPKYIQLIYSNNRNKMVSEMLTYTTDR